MELIIILHRQWPVTMTRLAKRVQRICANRQEGTRESLHCFANHRVRKSCSGMVLGLSEPRPGSRSFSCHQTQRPTPQLPQSVPSSVRSSCILRNVALLGSKITTPALMPPFCKPEL